MRKLILFLALAALPGLASAQQKTMIMISSANCPAAACTQEFQFCEQGSPGVLHRCNTATGFYAVVADALAGSTFDVQLKGATGAHDSSTLAGALQWDDVLGELDVAGLDVANTSDFGGSITLSLAGATVDGKDISGQGAFKNESNSFTEDQSVASGKKIGYEGAAGDTYTLRDIDREALETTVDGAIATRTEADNWRPPPCPADLNDVPFGGICMDTASGKIRYRGTLEAIP